MLHSRWSFPHSSVNIVMDFSLAVIEEVEGWREDRRHEAVQWGGAVARAPPQPRVAGGRRSGSDGVESAEDAVAQEEDAGART
jgi:hypothetical protein